ncbi:hypothetical protein CTAYLR_006624 [Chrysophaeum taylorii]|uniref:RanBP2-type domain-containing protein n=1 Tax=Chrysophaeum taylorii TaxID=2483200 RepID=A0AAD7UK61_9STRA|nr:hypothetical protein CTAYLR_006624 [Chrysophaeum taylorii]
MPGDWICHQCQNNNFARRRECRRCGTPRSDRSTVVGERPPPQQHGSSRPRGGGSSFIPGDWLCGRCSNHNFQWRTECKRCSAPRGADSQVIGKDGNVEQPAPPPPAPEPQISADQGAPPPIELPPSLEEIPDDDDEEDQAAVDQNGAGAREPFAVETQPVVVESPVDAGGFSEAMPLDTVGSEDVPVEPTTDGAPAVEPQLENGRHEPEPESVEFQEDPNDMGAPGSAVDAPHEDGDVPTVLIKRPLDQQIEEDEPAPDDDEPNLKRVKAEPAEVLVSEA